MVFYHAPAFRHFYFILCIFQPDLKIWTSESSSGADFLRRFQIWGQQCRILEPRGPNFVKIYLGSSNIFFYLFYFFFEMLAQYLDLSLHHVSAGLALWCHVTGTENGGKISKNKKIIRKAVFFIFSYFSHTSYSMNRLFGEFFREFSGPRSAQDGSKTIFKTFFFRLRFWHRFGPSWVAFKLHLGPLWELQIGPKSGATPLVRFKTIQEGSRRPKTA